MSNILKRVLFVHFRFKDDVISQCPSILINKVLNLKIRNGAIAIPSESSIGIGLMKTVVSQVYGKLQQMSLTSYARFKWFNRFLAGVFIILQV